MCVTFNYWHPNVVIEHMVFLVTDQVAGSWGGVCVTRPSITVVWIPWTLIKLQLKCYEWRLWLWQLLGNPTAGACSGSTSLTVWCQLSALFVLGAGFATRLTLRGRGVWFLFLGWAHVTLHGWRHSDMRGWQPWHAVRKDVADRHGVWQWCSLVVNRCWLHFDMRGWQPWHTVRKDVAWCVTVMQPSCPWVLTSF